MNFLCVLISLWCLIISSYSFSKPVLIPRVNALPQLYAHRLVDVKNPLRLHLGCGENHFETYVNIDFENTQHTVQTVSAADCYADITRLIFPENSVTEIRSHHVFEHFDRATALALLTAWHYWLTPGGILVIETPDFKKSLPLLFNDNLSYAQKEVVVRHLYGSHEAGWAFHRDGWYREKYQTILTLLGFEIVSIEEVGSLLRNIIVRARKKPDMPISTAIQTAKYILTMSMVNQSEQKLWETWCTQFDDALYTMISPS